MWITLLIPGVSAMPLSFRHVSGKGAPRDVMTVGDRAVRHERLRREIQWIAMFELWVLRGEGKMRRRRGRRLLIGAYYFFFFAAAFFAGFFAAAFFVAAFFVAMRTPPPFGVKKLNDMSCIAEIARRVKFFSSKLSSKGVCRVCRLVFSGERDVCGSNSESLGKPESEREALFVGIRGS